MKFALNSFALFLVFSTQAFGQSSDIQQLKAIISLQQNQIKKLEQRLNPPCDGKLSADKAFCFKAFTQPLSSPNADLSCVAWGGRLASIHSDADMRIVASMVSADTGAWIGAVRTASGFGWTDGTVAQDYAAWWPGEPNNANGIENCAITGFHAADRWGDFDCSMQTAYVCKRPMQR